MVRGTGPDARITAEDVETFVVSGPAPAVAAAAVPAAAAPAVAQPGVPGAAYEDIPLTSVRQVSCVSCLSPMCCRSIAEA